MPFPKALRDDFNQYAPVIVLLGKFVLETRIKPCWTTARSGAEEIVVHIDQTEDNQECKQWQKLFRLLVNKLLDALDDISEAAGQLEIQRKPFCGPPGSVMLTICAMTRRKRGDGRAGSYACSAVSYGWGRARLYRHSHYPECEKASGLRKSPLTFAPL